MQKKTTTPVDTVDLTAAYADMADDEARESEAEEWSDTLLWDSVEPQDHGELGLADEQLAELRQRRAELDADGDPGEPWEAVLDQMESSGR